MQQRIEVDPHRGVVGRAERDLRDQAEVRRRVGDTGIDELRQGRGSRVRAERLTEAGDRRVVERARGERAVDGGWRCRVCKRSAGVQARGTGSGNAANRQWQRGAADREVRVGVENPIQGGIEVGAVLDVYHVEVAVIERDSCRRIAEHEVRDLKDGLGNGGCLRSADHRNAKRQRQACREQILSHSWFSCRFVCGEG